MLPLLRLILRRSKTSRDDDARGRSANKKLGDAGETAAVKFLQQKGYRILERNHRNRGGEIDIIAEHRGTVVFVEVKTRSPRAWLSPESAVDEDKQARIARAANAYLEQFRNPSQVRFDVVTVLTDDLLKVSSIKLLRDAFRPGDNSSSASSEEVYG